MSSTGNLAKQVVEILDLSSAPVGIDFISTPNGAPVDAKKLQRHRYCQALMKARGDESVLLDAEGISCPAAAAAFGFRPLPENLENGRGLVGFGIVRDQAIGQRMFEGMSYLPMGQIAALHIFPLDRALDLPDVVVIEDEVEKLMWVSLAYLNITGGQRVQSSTAVLQATCVDATIIPYLEQRLNQCFGCYGCRDATDLGPNETVVGFPGALLPSLVETLGFLDQKAIPTSRSKKAFSALAI
ncbi:MAG: DUF169 domain-containing protein [Anaerolineales bacterium]|nr:DUF169 domain-containing protein [Anaerolineales bacterium]